MGPNVNMDPADIKAQSEYSGFGTRVSVTHLKIYSPAITHKNQKRKNHRKKSLHFSLIYFVNFGFAPFFSSASSRSLQQSEKLSNFLTFLLQFSVVFSSFFNQLFVLLSLSFFQCIFFLNFLLNFSPFATDSENQMSESSKQEIMHDDPSKGFIGVRFVLFGFDPVKKEQV